RSAGGGAGSSGAVYDGLSRPTRTLPDSRGSGGRGRGSGSAAGSGGASVSVADSAGSGGGGAGSGSSRSFTGSASMRSISASSSSSICRVGFGESAGRDLEVDITSPQANRGRPAARAGSILRAQDSTGSDGRLIVAS